MQHKFLSYLYDSFKKLVEKYGFSKSKEIIDEQYYMVEYRSDTFIIQIEKYRREFYVSLCKIDDSDNRVNLFNLLNYLNQASPDFVQSLFCEEVKDLDEYYKQQLDHITNTIDDNFAVINDFFKSENYESEMGKIEKFMIKKYPRLFKKL